MRMGTSRRLDQRHFAGPLNQPLDVLLCMGKSLLFLERGVEAGGPLVANP